MAGTKKMKKVLNLRSVNTEKTIKIMEALGKLDVEIIAESRPREVKIEIYGTKEEICKVERKILALSKK